MKLSYSTPSTMYTVTKAARMSSGSFDSEALNEAAVPSKPACKLAGMCRSFFTFSTAVDGIAQRGALWRG